MIKIILFIIVATTVISCDQGNKNKLDETPTRGNIKISVDESFQQLVDAEIYAFESQYKYAKVNASYKPENDILSDFFKDSVRLIVTTRKLTKAEEEGLRANSIIARTTKIAYDGLAFIVNPENPDTFIKFETVKGLFTGKINKWSQINEKSKLKDIKVVFDNNKSANVRFIMERFSLPPNFPPNCYAVNSNPEIISYVEKNKDAIGIISVNWISDKADSTTIRFLKRVKVVAIGSSTGENEYMQPCQGFIAEKSYPFTREVYAISRETFSGLGSGFIAYVAGDIGQRIVLRSGLVPATMPIRLLKVSSE